MNAETCDYCGREDASVAAWDDNADRYVCQSVECVRAAEDDDAQREADAIDDAWEGRHAEA